MKRTPLLLFLLCLFSSSPLRAEPSLMPTNVEPDELIIHNRIVAKVNGKTISVIDVMKKMDLFLQKHYPELVGSKGARFQFYSSQWRDYLTQMIDQELMLADAEHLEVKVSDAEVREEILERFGPNIMSTLDSIGLNYDEARKMVHDEMIVQRMLWFRVNSKALVSVNSRDIKTAYESYCAANPEMQEWHYQVLSIRSPNKQASEAIAHRAFDLLHSQMALAALPDALKPSEDDGISITVSSDLQADEKNISQVHKDVLVTLTENSYSKPIAQVSRIDNSVVYRIFHLKKHVIKKVPPFQKLADQLKDHLLQEAASKENAQYIAKLRQRLGYDEKHMMETLPNDFQPFALR